MVAPIYIGHAIPFSEEFSAVEVVYGIVSIAVVVKFLERQKINIVMRRGRKWLQRRLPYKKRESSFQKHVEPPLVMPEHSLKIGDSAILNRFELSHNQGITLLRSIRHQELKLRQKLLLLSYHPFYFMLVKL